MRSSGSNGPKNSKFKRKTNKSRGEPQRLMDFFRLVHGGHAPKNRPEPTLGDLEELARRFPFAPT